MVDISTVNTGYKPSSIWGGHHLGGQWKWYSWSFSLTILVSAWATRCADARFSECEMAIGPGSSGLGRPASQEEGPWQGWFPWSKGVRFRWRLTWWILQVSKLFFHFMPFVFRIYEIICIYIYTHNITQVPTYPFTCRVCWYLYQGRLI